MSSSSPRACCLRVPAPTHIGTNLHTNTNGTHQWAVMHDERIVIGLMDEDCPKMFRQNVINAFEATVDVEYGTPRRYSGPERTGCYHLMRRQPGIIDTWHEMQTHLMSPMDPNDPVSIIRTLLDK